jgi:alpha-ketoglutarate-dependent taurine dioxygenase
VEVNISMNCESISDLFHGGGLLIRPSFAGQAVSELDRDQIIALFEKHGVLLFRGFEIAPEKLSAITDRFTEFYAGDAVRRAPRFGQRMIRDVDSGHSEVPLHSEASFAASWPEIVWFYCSVPPVAGGSTTVCDGARLWQSLSGNTQAAFLAQPLRYEVAIEMGESASHGIEPWPSKSPGVSGHINWDTGVISLAILRYAVHETRTPGSLCFANHLLANGEPQVKKLTMADGTPIGPEALSEIKSIGEKLTFEVRWESRDLVMLDNIRVMHGRRAYDNNIKRDIVQIQTQRASFAYGSTTRRSRSGS